MVLDYSKWDALELSDDSDIEVHPNVDKRSFIRAKQNQIHQQRYERRHQIDTLKYEHIINNGLLRRIDKLLEALQKHKDDSRNPDELVFQSLIESAGDPAEDQPPAPPEGVYSREKEQPKYSKMMGTLIDQVKKEVDEGKSDDRYQAYIKGVEGHQTKVSNLQEELMMKLAQLEKEEGSKITSDSIHTGFDISHVNKAKPGETKAAATAAAKQPKAESVELLNAAPASRPGLVTNDTGISSGAEADIEDEEPDDDQVEPSVLGKQFATIKMGDYRASLQFISEHPDVVAERETDGLLVEAFNSQMSGKEAYARQCVHQGLLLQYCRSLGRDGIGIFFKRITTKGHQASQVFMDDVNNTYARIKSRTAELAKQSADQSPGVEQIQLHAVDPGTEIHINVPKAGSDEDVEQEARKIFESFPPGLQRALESEKLDEVNTVLGKMSVEEAEEIVELLGKGGMLSVEKEIIDATTEEGQKKLKEIESEGFKGREEDKEKPGDPE